MSLPEILVPAGVPPFRATGHALQRGGVHANLPRGTGHARKRPIRTAASNLISVSARVGADAAQALENWYENTLHAGALPFSARVFGLDTPDPVWWSATWEVPPQWDEAPGGFWIVSGQLRVTGEASPTGPTSTSAAAEFTTALAGAAVPVISSNAEVEFTAAMGTAAQASVEFTAALLAVINGAPVNGDDLDLRWTLMGLNYAPGYVADTVDDPSTTEETAARSYIETREP